jgi:hypothetical protein
MFSLRAIESKGDLSHPRACRATTTPPNPNTVQVGASRNPLLTWVWQHSH